MDNHPPMLGERKTSYLFGTGNCIFEITGLHIAAYICWLTLSAKILTFFKRHEFTTAFNQVMPELKVKPFKMCVKVSFHGTNVDKNREIFTPAE